MKDKIFNIVSLSINGLIFILTMIAWFYMMFFDKSTTLSTNGLESLQFFTVLSNLLMGLVSLIVFIYQLIGLIKGKNYLNQAIKTLLHAATTSITITLLVVVFFLAIVAQMDGRGYFSFFIGANLFFHLIIPLLAIINYLVFEYEPKIKYKYTLFSLLPMGLYAIFYVINYYAHLTSGLDGNYDWYGFIGDGSPIRLIVVVVLFVGGTIGLSSLIYLFNKLIGKKINKDSN